MVAPYPTVDWASEDSLCNYGDRDDVANQAQQHREVFQESLGPRVNLDELATGARKVGSMGEDKEMKSHSYVEENCKEICV